MITSNEVAKLTKDVPSDTDHVFMARRRLKGFKDSLRSVALNIISVDDDLNYAKPHLCNGKQNVLPVVLRRQLHRHRKSLDFNLMFYLFGWIDSSQYSCLTTDLKDPSYYSCLTTDLKDPSQYSCLTTGLKDPSQYSCLTTGLKDPSYYSCLTTGLKDPSWYSCLTYWP